MYSYGCTKKPKKKSETDSKQHSNIYKIHNDAVVSSKISRKETIWQAFINCRLCSTNEM